VVTISGNTGSGVAAITTTPTNVVSSSARLNGLVISNNVGSVNAYFEYGTTAALGLETSQQFVSASASNFFSTIATAPNTTYYYRAVVLSNGILYRGSIVSFTSSTDIVVTGGPNIVRPVIVVQGGGVGGGSPLVTLTINDQLQTVARGDIITYLVTYQNISGQTLSNVILNVILPTGVSYRSSSNGVLTTNNTVAASVGTLPPNAQGSMTIQASINETVANGSSLVATATLAFTTPSLAQDSAIAYDIDTVASRNALAGLAFWGGFFPNTLLGWIILLIIILLLILLARRYRDRYYRTVPAPMYGPHANQPPAPQYNYYGPAPVPPQPATPMQHQAHAPAPQPMHAPAPQQHGGYYPENLPH